MFSLTFALLFISASVNVVDARWPSGLTGLLNSPRRRLEEWIKGAEDSASRIALKYHGESVGCKFRTNETVIGPPSVYFTTEKFSTAKVITTSLPDGYSSNYFRGTDLETCALQNRELKIGQALSRAANLLNKAHEAYVNIDWNHIDGKTLDQSLQSAACSLLLNQNVLETAFGGFNTYDCWTDSTLVHEYYPSETGFATIAYEDGVFSGEKDTDFNDYVARIRIVHIYEVHSFEETSVPAYPGHPNDAFRHYVGSRIVHIPAARGTVSDSRLVFLQDVVSDLSTIDGIDALYQTLIDNFAPISTAQKNSSFVLDSSVSVFTYKNDLTNIRRVAANNVVNLGFTRDFLPVHSGLPILQPARQFTNTLASKKIPWVPPVVSHTLFIGNSRNNATWQYTPSTIGVDGYPGARFVLIVSAPDQVAPNDDVENPSLLEEGTVLNLLSIDDAQIEHIDQDVRLAEGIVAPRSMEWMLEGYPIDNYKRGRICIQSANNVGETCVSSNCAYGFCDSANNQCINSNGTHPIIGQFNLTSIGETCTQVQDNFCLMGECFAGETPYYGFFQYVVDILSAVADGETLPYYWKQVSSPLAESPKATEYLYQKDH